MKTFVPQPTTGFMTSVTCRLTAKKPGSAPSPALIIEYGNALLLRPICFCVVCEYIWCVALCISPSPVNADPDKCNKHGAGKRPAEDVGNGEPTLSRNKLKKLRRNAAKSFVPKADKFAKCGTCGNPKVCLASNEMWLDKWSEGLFWATILPCQHN